MKSRLALGVFLASLPAQALGADPYNFNAVFSRLPILVAPVDNITVERSCFPKDEIGSGTRDCIDVHIDWNKSNDYCLKAEEIRDPFSGARANKAICPAMFTPENKDRLRERVVSWLHPVYLRQELQRVRFSLAASAAELAEARVKNDSVDRHEIESALSECQACLNSAASVDEARTCFSIFAIKISK